MTHKIHEKLPFAEAKGFAEELFPIGSTIIVHINEKLPKGCPAIVLGHLLSKKDIEKSVYLLNKVEIAFQQICHIVVLCGKQKLVCYFDYSSGKMNVFTTNADIYDKNTKSYYDDWIKVGKHIN